MHWKSLHLLLDVWCSLDDKESASNDEFSMTGPVNKAGAVVLGKLLSQNSFLPV